MPNSAEEPEVRVTKVAEKWGFGMAPVKPTTQQERIDAISCSIELINTGSGPIERESALSVVKGLFNRVARQDQWDWFTVFEGLGRPGRKKSRDIAHQLTGLRRTLIGKDDRPLHESIQALKMLDIKRHLESYIGDQPDEPTGDQIYILSSREHPSYLKIGFTTRSVGDRVKEINSATGVLIPFGVRAVWRVRNGREMEQRVHAMLSEYRIRNDREFFDLPYEEAFKIVLDTLKRESGEEL